MATKEKIILETQFLSDRLSTQVRYVALGILGIVWGFFVSNQEITKLIVTKFGKWLMGVIILSLTVLMFDYLQYVAGYVNSKKLIDSLERSKKDEGEYDKESCSYKIRTASFISKQILLVVDVVVFLSILFLSLN